MRAAARAGGDLREVPESDISFHETLVHLGGSPRLARMYSTLAAETRMILYGYPPYPAVRNVEDHQQILDALAAQSDEAVALLGGHLRFSARFGIEDVPP